MTGAFPTWKLGRRRNSRRIWKTEAALFVFPPRVKQEIKDELDDRSSSDVEFWVKEELDEDLEDRGRPLFPPHVKQEIKDELGDWSSSDVEVGVKEELEEDLEDRGRPYIPFRVKQAIKHELDDRGRPYVQIAVNEDIKDELEDRNRPGVKSEVKMEVKDEFEDRCPKLFSTCSSGSRGCRRSTSLVRVSLAGARRTPMAELRNVKWQETEGVWMIASQGISLQKLGAGKSRRRSSRATSPSQPATSSARPSPGGNRFGGIEESRLDNVPSAVKALEGRLRH